MENQVKKILLLSTIVLLLMPVSLSAQQAPPVLPITLDAKDLDTLMQIVGRIPYSEASPIVAFLQQKEQMTVTAASAPKSTETQKPAEEKPK